MVPNEVRAQVVRRAVVKRLHEAADARRKEVELLKTLQVVLKEAQQEQHSLGRLRRWQSLLLLVTREAVVQHVINLFWL